jgi:hypothetical protein
LFAATFTDEGRPLFGTEEFASCAWATGRLIDPGPTKTDWLDGFDEAEAACRTEFLRMASPAEHDTRAAELSAQGHAVGRPVDTRSLYAFIDSVIEQFNVQVVLAPRALRVKSAPDHTPSGRWPSNPGQSLALSQQFAINTILGTLEQGPGLFAVNGPPGSGKTTMLRELIAALVVKRAIRLAELDKPEDAFRTCYNWKSGNYVCMIWGWDPAFTGFEIVVASANNGAVENISKEIPGRSAIDCEGAGYYPELATLVLNSGNDPAQQTTAWGLVAARAAVHQIVTELPAAREDIEALRIQQSAVESRRAEISAELAVARDGLAQAQHAVARANQAVDAHRRRRPGFLVLGSTARGWRAADREFAAALALRGSAWLILTLGCGS